MPVPPRVPGVYVVERDGFGQPVIAAPTGIAAFIGRAVRGPVNDPIPIRSVAEFERVFGGLHAECALGYAVRDFFRNGGSSAVVVRLYRPHPVGAGAPEAPAQTTPLSAGGLALTADDFLPVDGVSARTGLYALERASSFNLLCIPPYAGTGEAIDVDPRVIAAAATYCEARRAMLILDAPSAWTSVDLAMAGVAALGTDSRNAAVYFPRLRQPDPLRGNQVGTFPACGAVAGVYADTDRTRGVWKAPAGLEASLDGVTGLALSLTDAENGALNQQAINCLRVMPRAGPVVWGARTRRGADGMGDVYKYVPVRRLALCIEQSLVDSLQWVVFEPNDEPLWAKIRNAVTGFLQTLFMQGAFQGSSAAEAFFVTCDATTTTQDDRAKGRVNIIVGFAATRPAEFVIVTVQQRTAT